MANLLTNRKDFRMVYLEIIYPDTVEQNNLHINENVTGGTSHNVVPNVILSTIGILPLTLILSLLLVLSLIIVG
jgi:hypothetical protein